MDCRHLENLYELFLLGALSKGDAARIHEHVDRGCPDCLGGLRQATLTLFALLQPDKPANLNPRQKSRLLARIKEK